jgi:hypothetical protein
MCYTVADFLKRHVPGFDRCHVAHVGVDNGIRTSRMIRGRSTLGADITAAPGPTTCPDTVGMLPVWDRELAGGEFVRDYTYDIPFGITVPVGCENLLVASGKSVSTERIGMLRSMGGCMICGQASGAAAALAAKSGVGPAGADIRETQRELLRQGVYLGPDERLRELGLED